MIHGYLHVIKSLAVMAAGIQGLFWALDVSAPLLRTTGSI